MFLKAFYSSLDCVILSCIINIAFFEIKNMVVLCILFTSFSSSSPTFLFPFLFHFAVLQYIPSILFAELMELLLSFFWQKDCLVVFMCDFFLFAVFFVSNTCFPKRKITSLYLFHLGIFVARSSVFCSFVLHFLREHQMKKFVRLLRLSVSPINSRNELWCFFWRLQITKKKNKKRNSQTLSKRATFFLFSSITYIKFQRKIYSLRCHFPLSRFVFVPLLLFFSFFST